MVASEKRKIRKMSIDEKTILAISAALHICKMGYSPEQANRVIPLSGYAKEILRLRYEKWKAGEE